jgi:hypothetical protein
MASQVCCLLGIFLSTKITPDILHKYPIRGHEATFLPTGRYVYVLASQLDQNKSDDYHQPCSVVCRKFEVGYLEVN